MNHKKPSILWTLYRVWRVWRRYPEQRLGQLIDNAIENSLFDPDLFSIRDENLIADLEWFATSFPRTKPRDYSCSSI